MNPRRFIIPLVLLIASAIPMPLSAQYWQDINGIPSPSILCEVANGRILVGTASQGIYYTDDAGKTWMPTQLHRQGYAPYLITGKGTNVFALVDQGGTTEFYRSTDNGMSWTSSSFNPLIDAIAVSDSGQLFGVGFYHDTTDLYYFYRYRVYRFDGNSWEPIGTTASSFSGVGSPSIPSFVIDHANNFYFSVKDGTNGKYGMFVSSDEGLTWTWQLPDRLMDQIAVTRSNVIIAGIRSQDPTQIGVFKSTDGGNSWGSLGLNGKYPIRGIALGDSGETYVATPESVYQYLGYYGGWKVMDLPPDLIDWSSYGSAGSPLVLTSSGTVMACGGVFGVYRSTDQGNSWLPNGPRSRDIFSLVVDDAGTVFAGTLGNRMYFSADQGQDWLQTAAGSTCDYVYSLMKRGSQVYAGTDCGAFRSTDNGVHWLGAGQEEMTGAVYSLLENSAHVLFAASAFGVYRAADEGSNWAPVGLSNMVVLSLAADSAGNVYAATKNSGIYASTNNGITWVSCGAIRNDIGALAVNSVGNVFAGIFGGILRSSDNGATWVEKDFITGYVYSLAFKGSQSVFAGTYKGVYASYDNGDHWKLLSTKGLSQPLVLSLAFDPAGNLVAGTYHGGLYRTTQSFTSVEEQNVFSKGFQLHQNYPNPFNPTTQIQFSLPGRSYVSLKVFDLLGRQVATLVDGEQKVGEHVVTFDASKLSAGSYFYRLTTQEKTVVRKMLLLR